MREVAALAGVSIKTVSRVANGEPGVAPAVRERVQQAIGRLDYRPNLGASTLRRAGGRTALVGALLQDLSNSYSAGVLRALGDASRATGRAVVAASLDEDPDREQALVRNLVERRVEGLVLMPATDRQDYLAAEVRAGLPTVFVDRRPTGVAADSVTVDNRLGAELVVRHLHGRGHRRITALTDLARIQTARDRAHGFTRAIRAAGLSAQQCPVRTDVRTGEEATEVVLALLDGPDPPTALFAARNVLAIGAITALRARGRHRDIAVVGYDDVAVADLMGPPLTVVRQDVQRIGVLVAELLSLRLDDRLIPPRDIVLDPVLVPRGSGELPPPQG